MLFCKHVRLSYAIDAYLLTNANRKLEPLHFASLLPIQMISFRIPIQIQVYWTCSQKSSFWKTLGTGTSSSSSLASRNTLVGNAMLMRWKSCI